MRGSVSIAFEGDCRHGNDGEFGKALLQPVEFCLAIRQTEAPAIIVYRDPHVIRILQGCRAAIERRIVKLPLR